MLNIALPKGRLGDEVTRRLGASELSDNLGRRLTLEDTAAGLRYFLVKPWDVPVYVESGVADLGISGRDTLLESGADVYELMDLGFGRCRMAVAGFPGTSLTGSIQVATKYPSITRQYFEKRGGMPRIIKLSGSVELAPVLGLSDVIMDIVESGDTLRANGLTVLEEVMPISARLIANKACCKFKGSAMDALMALMANTDRCEEREGAR